MKRLSSLVVAACCLALVGCGPAPSTSTPATTAGGTPGRASGTNAATASGSIVDQAKLKAAQYDYDGALALLGSDASASAQQAIADITAAKNSAQPIADAAKVPHLFWHPLVIDPYRAFSSPQIPAFDRAGNAQYMVTQSEFAAQLQSIYDKGYVLVHPQRLFARVNGVVTNVSADLKLPPGKKPLVISEDDVNYYSRWDNAGFPRQLKISSDGRVVNTYQDAQGAWTEGAYDVITVIDEFVAQHPDFSFRGDKGTIAVTGYEGVLGYRTSVKKFGDTDATKQAIADATKVADALKAEGWQFACHTWNHISYQASSVAQIKADLDLWNAEVQPIVGKTPLMIYAFGSDIQFGIGKVYAPTDPKFVLLRDQGYDYFFPIDNSSPYYAQVKPDYYRQWRVNIDGITMQKVRDGKPTALPLFFDTLALWDAKRPIPTPTTATGVK